MKASQSTTASAIATLAITALLLGGCAAVEGAGNADAGTTGSQNNQDSSSTPSDVVQIPEGDITVEVFTASDLDPSVGPIIEDTLLAAGELWGLYWPVEYWVMGLTRKPDKSSWSNIASAVIRPGNLITPIAWAGRLGTKSTR